MKKMAEAELCVVSSDQDLIMVQGCLRCAQDKLSLTILKTYPVSIGEGKEFSQVGVQGYKTKCVCGSGS